MEKIKFDTDEGPVELFVLEQTMLGGINYILVTEELECEEGTFLILKEDKTKSEDEIASYIEIEDERELDSVIKIFDELLEDLDLEV